MTETEDFEINLDLLMEKIREEVRERKKGGTELSRTVPREGDAQRLRFYADVDLSRIGPIVGQESFQQKEQGYHINDFLKYHGEQFVINAYLGILKRAPDSEGLTHFLESLHSGKLTKADVLGRLRYSPEGRAGKVRIKGLFWNFVVQSFFKIPILGFFFRILIGILNFGKIIKNIQILEESTLALHQKQCKELAAVMEKLGTVFARKADREELGNLKNEFQSILDGKAGKADIEGLDQRIREIIRNIKDQKLEVIDQQRNLEQTIEELSKRLQKLISINQLHETFATKDGNALDGLYVSFEDLFRGTREFIKEEQQVYLSYLEQTEAGSEKAPVLDLGCGRGEWLELLKENGYASLGVDLNRIFVQQCLELGLDVVEADLIDFLRAQQPNTYGAISGFHIVEHLPLNSLISLLDESLRVLKSGGIVIFETPNPENLFVGATLFYADPTHRSPLLPDTLRFLFEYRGFVRVQTLRLHRRDQPVYTNQRFVDEVIYKANMEQDYSIIGFKP